MARGNPNSLTVKATLGLRELIFAGAFLPGERVAELALVERLGVSRTPLRLALLTLEHEGLLETLRGGGFVVRQFTRDDINDGIELRATLEGTAARFAAERLGSPAELEPLQETSAQLDEVVGDESIDAFVRYLTLNERFHATLVELAKSQTLARAIANVLALPFASPSALLSSHADLPQSREILVVAQHQHRGIVDALERGQGSRAEEIAREHARISRTNLDLVLANRKLLEQLPGAPLLRAV
jgi:GntR family transcriptional regulator, vanillate catabolism transcriptional regulator